MYSRCRFGDFDPYFKIICKFIRKMMLSLKPEDGFFFPNLQKVNVYLFDKTQPLFGLMTVISFSELQVNFP